MENNIFKSLLIDDNVNNYTKMYIALYQLNYFKNYYIPNKLLMNRLGLSKREVIRLINIFKAKKIITVKYINNRRYFKFNNNNCERANNISYDALDYDWLNDI